MIQKISASSEENISKSNYVISKQLINYTPYIRLKRKIHLLKALPTLKNTF